MTTSVAQQLVAVWTDPVRFSRGVLGHRPWRRQREIMYSVWNHRRTYVKACHSSGKTFCAADIALAWAGTFPDGIVITTAPTWLQVEKLLWARIHSALRTSKIKFPPANKTELYITEDNYILGISTNEPERFQGWHGHVLIILDEAPGVRPTINDAIAGIRAGGTVHELHIGNPIVTSGPFYDAFHDNRSHGVPMTISAFDTPNLQGYCLDTGETDAKGRAIVLGNAKGIELQDLDDDELDENPVPYLTTKRWVVEQFEEWGLHNPLFESKVLGEFPSQAEDSIFHLADLEAAREPIADGATQYEPIDIGIDVAGPGEAESSLTAKRRSNMIHHQQWSLPDPRGAIIRSIDDIAPANRIRRINVDSVGIGYHLATHLRDRYGDKVRFVNVGERAHNPRKFFNRRAEIAWGLRMLLKEREVGGLTDDKTIGQLAGIKYGHKENGKVYVESKEDAMKDRGVKSPDRGESVILCYAETLPEDFRIAREEQTDASKYPRARR